MVRHRGRIKVGLLASYNYQSKVGDLFAHWGKPQPSSSYPSVFELFPCAGSDNKHYE